MRIKFTLSVLILLCTNSFAQTTCTDSLKGVADYDASLGFHDGTGAANTNYGTAQTAAFWIPGVASPGGFNGNRALIHFNLSTIPVNATITAAYLDLYALYPLGTLPGHVQNTNNDGLLQRATGTWTEMGVTWNTQPGVTTVNQVTLTGTSTYSLDYLNINVTNLIKDIHGASNNYGFLLKLANEAVSNCLSFCSEDHSNPAKRPYLRVYYSCVTDIREQNNGINCIVSPNPFVNTLTISLSGIITGQYDLAIYDVTGKEIAVKKGLKEENQFFFSELNGGLYFYKILKDSKPVKTGKMIKE